MAAVAAETRQAAISQVLKSESGRAGCGTATCEWALAMIAKRPICHDEELFVERRLSP